MVTNRVYFILSRLYEAAPKRRTHPAELAFTDFGFLISDFRFLAIIRRKPARSVSI
jgi:hypothetical protein